MSSWPATVVTQSESAPLRLHTETGVLTRSRSIFDGTRDIAVTKEPEGLRVCLHEDLHAAEATIARLREAVNDYGMHIVMAHDAEFIKNASDKELNSIMHPLFDADCVERIRAGQQP